MAMFWKKHWSLKWRARGSENDQRDMEGTSWKGEQKC